METPERLACLLERIHRQVVKLGPREHLAVERLLRSRQGRWSPGDLRAALASVLARDPEQWDQVAELFDEQMDATQEIPERPRQEQEERPLDALVPGPEEPSPGQRLECQTVVLRPQGPGWRLRHLVGRARRMAVVIGSWFRNAPRAWWVSALAGGIGVSIAAALWHLSLPPAPADAQRPPRHSGAAAVIHPEPREESGERLEIQSDLLPLPSMSHVRTTVEALHPASISVLVMVSVMLLTLGLRLAKLPESARESERQLMAQHREKADIQRRDLDERKARTRSPVGVSYRIDRFFPVSPKAVLDSAELLGRLFLEQPGEDIDPSATLDRTIEAGGRFVPVEAVHRSRHEILVLVDTERGDHPWLGAFRRLLGAWSTQGLTVRCYEFGMSPELLTDPQTRAQVRIDSLARRMEGLPLIVFSRALDMRGRTSDELWSSCLGAWPRRAWIDPDPRRPVELGQLQRRELHRLEHLGLRRFYLSDEGIVLMARWLATGGECSSVVTEPALPQLPPRAKAGEGDPLGEALFLWAAAASLVPDPTWDQLEAIRRYFPEIRAVAREPRYVQRLIEWVQRETGRATEDDYDRGLKVPPALQDRWLRELRGSAHEQGMPDEERFEHRARRLLLQQLGPTRPADPLDFSVWRLKRSLHEAILSPEKAAKLLEWAFESPLAPEAARLIEQELRRQANGVGASFPRTDAELLNARCGGLRGVPVRALVCGPWPHWIKPVLSAALLGAAVLIGLILLAAPVGDAFAKRVKQANPSAPIHALVEMVTIQGGTFQMGSEAGDSDEVPVHPVTVTSFQISRTEVTVAQYSECVDAGACPALGEGDACNWGRPGKSDHPINCVSWDDAQRFAEWVEARLPTEAEWEYAARSGGLAREYPWGDEPADCGRAVVDRADDGTSCGNEGTKPVCSRMAGNTEQEVCDMAGNVWEWVEDDWHKTYIGAPDTGSTAWIEEPRAISRVFRGGSWGNAPRFARVALRPWDEPSARDANLGFRVARSIPSAL